MVFNVFTPIVIGKPVPISPTGSANDVQPRFVIGNAQRSGPVGPMVYWIEVSDNDAFTNMLASWAVPEQPTQTTRDSPIRSRLQAVVLADARLRADYDRPLVGHTGVPGLGFVRSQRGVRLSEPEDAARIAAGDTSVLSDANVARTEGRHA